MNITYIEFLGKLKLARKEAGLTQIETADALGRSQASISKIEKGEVPLSVEELLEFARVFNKPANYFFEKTE